MVNTQECFISNSFIELVGYYKIFKEVLSKIVHLITYLQTNGIKFEWRNNCEENFNLLKEILTIAPILYITNPNEIFLVCTNAWKEVIGGVLTKNRHFISYEFKNLK